MKQHSLSKTGLGLSQTQSISNLCNQKAVEIANMLTSVANFTKSVQIDGIPRIIQNGKKIPGDIVVLLKEKASYHACQAFLRENMKAKEALLEHAKNVMPDISVIIFPERYVPIKAKVLPNVNEDFGWEQLSASELDEFYEVDAYASHIGQFFHKGGSLDTLRKELPNLPAIEWMTIKDGEKTPVTINLLHKPEELFTIHEELAGIHRQYEQRVNYFKAKVKNLTTEENARIAKINADAQNEVERINKENQAKYDSEYNTANGRVTSIRTEFEQERQARIKEIAKLRIKVDPRFQPIIDRFLNQLPPEEEEKQ